MARIARRRAPARSGAQGSPRKVLLCGGPRAGWLPAQAPRRSRCPSPGDRAAGARARTLADIPEHRRMLCEVTRAALKGHDRLVYASVAWSLANAAQGTRFSYGGIGDFGGGNPYVISQQDGAYQGIPEFL